MRPHAIKKERRHRCVAKLLVLLAVAQDAEEQLYTSSEPRAGAFCYRGLEYLIKYFLIRRLESLVFQLALHHICQGIYQRQELIKLKRLASCMESIPIHRLPPEHHPVHDMFQRQMPVQQVPQGVLYIKHHGKHQRRTNQCGSFSKHPTDSYPFIYKGFG